MKHRRHSMNPIDDLKNEPEMAIKYLLQKRAGEVLSAITHPILGDIDFVYGKPGLNGYGLAHIQSKHPNALSMLPGIIINGEIIERSANRVKIATPDHRALIRLDWDGQGKKWLLTAFETNKNVRPATDMSTDIISTSDAMTQTPNRLDNNNIPQTGSNVSLSVAKQLDNR